MEDAIFLKRSKLFSVMKTSELRAMAAIVQEMSFHPNQVIVQENDVGDSLFVIKQGSVKIVKNSVDTQPIELAILNSGDCFGEMALFDAELRSATVVAQQHCVLLCIKSDDIHDVLVDNPGIGVEFIKIFIKRLREANKTIQLLSSKK